MSQNEPAHENFDSEPTIVAAVFFVEERAVAAVQALSERGFNTDSIEVSSRDVPAPHQDDAPGDDPIVAGAGIGAVAGGFVGGVFGLLFGMGSVLDQAATMAARSVLTGAGVGVAVGLVIGGIIGMRVSKRIAARQVEELYHGAILIAVDASQRQADAKSVLIHHGGDLGPTNVAEAMPSETARAAYLL